MAITKAQKQEIGEKLTGIAKKSESVAFANFHGLPVEDTRALRQTLRENGVSYYVAKKSLIRRVFGEQGFEGEMPDLNGEIAVAYADDALTPSREIYNFANKSKDMKEKLSLVGGVYEGTYKNAVEMTEIASIPSIDVLRGMFVNVINSPIQRTAIALSEIAKIKI